MRLRYLKPSPFARKVLVVAHEVGVAERIDLVETDTRADPTLAEDNPLGKVPCLIRDDGGPPLFDSRVIGEYLDAAFNGGRLLPSGGEARWRALRWQAMAEGIMEALVLCRYEAMRPEDRRSAEWVERQRTKAARAVDRLEEEADDLAASGLSLGQIAVGCALGYIDFRFADWDWRRDHPRLAAWYAGFAERPSMCATVPTD